MSLLVLVASMNAVAALTYTAKANLTLKGSDDLTCTIAVAQSDDPSISMYSAEMNMDYREMAFYAINGTTKYQVFAANTLGNLPFGLKTNGVTSYTLTVSSVEGAQTLVLLDTETSTLFNLTEGAVYNFTATANETNETRFHLFVAPSTPEICHRYGKLQVSGSTGQNVVVKNMDDSATSIGTVAITADYQEIAVEGVLAAGQYKVEWNSQTLIIDVK